MSGDLMFLPFFLFYFIFFLKNASEESITGFQSSRNTWENPEIIHSCTAAEEWKAGLQGAKIDPNNSSLLFICLKVTVRCELTTCLP